MLIKVKDIDGHSLWLNPDHISDAELLNTLVEVVMTNGRLYRLPHDEWAFIDMKFSDESAPPAEVAPSVLPVDVIESYRAYATAEAERDERHENDTGGVLYFAMNAKRMAVLSVLAQYIPEENAE